MSNVLSVVAGFFLGALVSFAFYLLGRADADIASWRSLMFSAVFRLKQMTPTSRKRVPGGYGISETENFLTCLAETVALSGWRDGATALHTVVSDMARLAHYEHPDESQCSEREMKKKEWEAHLYRQIQELSRWQSSLRLALPSRTAEFMEAQFQ